MRSVADDLRFEQMQKMRAMTPAARIELALALGRQAIEVYMAANQVDRPTAVATLRRNGAAGRTRSRSHDEP